MATPVPDAFQAVADASRRQMLHLLSKKTLTINELAGNFNMSRPAVSKHLKILQQAGFISIKDIGRERHCLLQPAGFNELQQWIAYFDAFWSSRMQKLQQLLDKKGSA